MASVDIHRLFLDILLERCRSCAAELDSILALDYPSAAPDSLAQCLLEGIQRLLVKIEKLRDLVQQSGTIPFEEIEAEAATAWDYISSVSGVLCPMLRNCASTQVPSELVLPLERLTRLVFPDSQVIIEAVPEFNYYFRDFAPAIWNLFSSVDLDDVLEKRKFPKELFRLQLSSNPPCGILTHCLLGHEIGHALYQKRQADENLLPLLSIDEQEIRRLIDRRLSELQEQASVKGEAMSLQLPLEQSRGFMEYAAKTQIVAIAASWIREIFCDVAGVGLFGPAFICSAGTFLLPFEDIDDATTYPPSRLRMQLALRALKRHDPGFGYGRSSGGESLKAAKQVFDPWQQFLGKRPSKPKDTMFQMIFKYVYKLGDPIIREARQALGRKSFGPNRFDSEVPPLRKRIRAGLPPNEY